MAVNGTFSMPLIDGKMGIFNFGHSVSDGTPQSAPNKFFFAVSFVSCGFPLWHIISLFSWFNRLRFGEFVFYRSLSYSQSMGTVYIALL